MSKEPSKLDENENLMCKEDKEALCYIMEWFSKSDVEHDGACGDTCDSEDDEGMSCMAPQHVWCAKSATIMHACPIEIPRKHASKEDVVHNDGFNEEVEKRKLNKACTIQNLQSRSPQETES